MESTIFSIVIWGSFFVFIILISPVLEKYEANKKRLKEIQRQIEEQREEQRENERQAIYNGFLSNWLVNKGKQYESDRGYPLDWKLRRQAILVRDNFRCQICGEDFPCSFEDSFNWESEFFNSDGTIVIQPKAGYICHGAHVHHKVKISNGGTHEPENLVLLCETCHTKQEGHKALSRRIKSDQYHRTYTRNNTLKKARTIHKCDICVNLWL